MDGGDFVVESQDNVVDANVVPHNVESVGYRKPPTGAPFVATMKRTMNVGENPASILNEEQLHAIWSLYGLPSNKICLPREDWRPDWKVKGYMCFYEILFKLGLRFPLPPFILDVLSLLDIAPSQLMPNAWRVLLGMITLCEESGNYPSVEELFHFYTPKWHDRDTCRVQFHPRGASLIIHPSKTDSSVWKSHYFYVKTSLVFGGAVDDRVPLHWRDVKSFPRVAVGFFTLNLAERLLKYPEEKRRSENLLKAEVLVDIELWDRVVETSKLSRDKYLKVFMEKVKDYPILSAKELYGDSPRKKKRKANVSVIDIGEDSATEITSSLAASPQVGVTQLESRIQIMKLRDEASLVKHSDAFRGEELKLLLPKDRSHFESIGPAETASYAIVETLRGAQAMIKLADDIKSFASKVEELETSNKCLRDENDGLELKASQMLQRAEKAEKELEELRATLRTEAEKAHKVGFKMARHEAMVQFHTGEYKKWKSIWEIKKWRHQLGLSINDEITDLPDDSSDEESNSQNV